MSDLALRVQQCILVACGFLLFSLPLAVQSQTAADRSAQQELASALRVIRPLLREDAYRAVMMLNKLVEDYPTHSHVLNLLGEAYQVVGEVDSAKATYEKCFRHHPTDLVAGASLGMLYIQEEEREKGERIFRDLLDRTEHRVNTYRTIALTLSNNGLFDYALRYYREGRDRNNGNYILTLDIAYLEKTMGNFDVAMEEYVFLIKTSPRHDKMGRSKLLGLLRDPRADNEHLLELLREHTAVGVPYRTKIMDILATAYLEKGMLESAIEMALATDEAMESDGKMLFDFASHSLNEYQRLSIGERDGYFALSLRALEAFIDGHPSSPHVPRAKLMLVDLLVDVAKGRVPPPSGIDLARTTDRVMETLDWLIETFPGTDYADQAYVRKGDVVLRIEKNPEKALKIYKEGMAKARTNRNAFAERLGQLYLVTGEFGSAQTHFGELVKSPNPELHETGVYYSGLLLCFTGEYEQARDTLTALAENNSSSPYTNDAIELAWVIEEGLKGQQGTLRDYVAAIRADVARDTTAAIGKLKNITQGPVDTPLRSRALFKLGEIYGESGDGERAVTQYQQFINDYPEDIQIPEAHRRIGQVYEHGYGDLDRALSKYESILVMYPYYLFLDEVRSDVTRIRDQLGER